MTDKDIEFLKREIGKLNGAHWYFLRLINQDLSEGSSPTFDDLTLEGILTLEDTTASDEGVIYKDTTPFIHNFHHPTGGAETPNGHNTFIGENAGNFTTGSTAAEPEEGSENVGIGYRALNSNTTGYNNSAIGASALENNTTGYYNLALGEEALASNTTGFGNTIIGRQAGYSMISGSYNTIIGLYAGKLNTTGSENVFIGNGAGGAETGSNKLYISDSATVTPLIYGEFDTPVLKIHGSLVVNEAGEDYDTRIEGSTDENLVVVDAGNNRLGVGTATPSVKLDINGDVNADNLQDLATTDSPTFVDITATGDVGVTGDVTAANLQDLATTDSPTFVDITATGDVGVTGDVTAANLQDLATTDSPTFDGLTLTGGAAINDGGGDNDTYIEGNTDTKLFYVDAGNDRIGIGKNNPAYKLDVSGDIYATGDLRTSGSHVGGSLAITNGGVINESGGDNDTRIEGDTDANLVFVDAGNDRVGIGTNTPGALLDVDGDLDVGGDVDLAGHDLRCGSYANLTDNSATSFTPLTESGVLFLYFRSGTRALGIISYRASSSPAGYVITQEIAGRIEIATTSLDGTTGSDTKFTVGVTNGAIYLENRLGSTINVGYFTLGN
jgi:hypothetical protein